MDRPSRSRKSIDYSKFGGLDADDDFKDEDDDFSTPPPPKKQKKDKTEKKKKERSKKEQKTTEIRHESKVEVTSRPKKERLTTEELEFKQQLELAMAMSQQECGVEQPELPPIVNLESTPPVVIHDNPPSIVEPEESPPNLNPPDEPPKLVSASAQRRLSEEADKIDILEEDVIQSDTKRKTQSTSRRKATKKPQYIDSDDDDDVESDFVPSDKESSDDDFNPNDDSDDDFGPSKKSKNKSQPKNQPKKSTKENVKPLKSVTTSKSVNNTKVVNTAKVATPKTTPRSNLVSAKPISHGLTKAGPKAVSAVTKTPSSIRSNVMTSHIKSPGITPKAVHSSQSLGGVNLKSPGGLRLGLSKHSKVKPLHSNVKIPT